MLQYRHKKEDVFAANAGGAERKELRAKGKVASDTKYAMIKFWLKFIDGKNKTKIKRKKSLPFWASITRGNAVHYSLERICSNCVSTLLNFILDIFHDVRAYLVYFFCTIYSLCICKYRDLGMIIASEWNFKGNTM